MDNVNELQELFTKEEPLTEALRPYLKENGVGSSCIHHPLVIEIFYDPKHCALINKRFELKTQLVREAKLKCNWPQYVFLHERPYRLNALVQALHDISKEALPELLREVWIDSENIYQNQSMWTLLWDTAIHRATMDDDELSYLKALPAMLTIYRGVRSPRFNKRGLSWTLDKEKANWFAKRFTAIKPTLLTMTLAKSRVAAYFDSRGEKEIIVLPKHIKQFKEEQLT